MFTGIIQAVGRVAEIQPRGGDVRWGVEAGELRLDDVAVGDSIAVSGVCLTVIRTTGGLFWVDVSGETLSRSVLGSLAPGSEVNLEKALTPTTRLGGHLVSGHVDGVGEVVERHSEGRSVRLAVRVPDGLARYIAAKGSICLDGVSLTVNRVDGAVFELNIIPHTLNETTIRHYAPGSRINVEVDLIARYLERLVLGERAAVPGGGGLSEAFLAEHGFIGEDA